MIETQSDSCYTIPDKQIFYFRKEDASAQGKRTRIWGRKLREQKREKRGDTGDRVILDDIMRDREVEWREISTVKEHMM